MKIADLIRQMAELGAPPAAIALAVEAIENATAKDAERRAKQAARKRKSRDSHGTVTGQECDGHATVSSPASPPSSPLINPLTSSPSPSPSGPLASLARADWPADAFDRFWKAYPHKVGRKAALRAIAVAKRTGVKFQTLMFGLDRYIAEKPPDRAWCNPATWLNQGRWDDEPAVTATGPPTHARPLTPSEVKQAEMRKIRAKLQQSIADDIEAGRGPTTGLLPLDERQRSRDVHDGADPTVLDLQP